MESRKKAFIGVDIGGTKIEGVLFRAGKIQAHNRISTPRSRPSFLRAIFGLIGGLAGEYKLSGVGLACAGAMDLQRKVILNSPNLKFLNGMALPKAVEEKFPVPVRIDNDTNCFLLAESLWGQARGKKHVVALTLGSGVGGAILADGKLLRGSHGAAGELGHIILPRDRELYSVEDLISKKGFIARGGKDGIELAKKAARGNSKAKAIFVAMGRDLGVTLASLVNMFDPQVIILGGGIAKANQLFISAAKSEMAKYTLLPKQYLPPIKISTLKYAGPLGAVALFGAEVRSKNLAGPLSGYGEGQDEVVEDRI